MPFASGPPVELGVYVAVKVVLVAGTVISWVAAPPSDQRRERVLGAVQGLRRRRADRRIMPTTFGIDGRRGDRRPVEQQPQPGRDFVCSVMVASAA